MSGHQLVLVAAATATAATVGVAWPGVQAVAAEIPPRPACAPREPTPIGNSGMMRTWHNVLLVDAGERCKFRGTLHSYYWKDEEIVERVTPNYEFWAEYEYRANQWTLIGIPS